MTSRLPIYICCDHSLTASERIAIRMGVAEVSKIFGGPTIVNYSMQSWLGNGRISGQTIIDRADIINEKINASAVMRDLQNENRKLKEPGMIVLFTGKDITLPGMSYCFGAANHSRHTAVLSVARFRTLTDVERSRCIRRTLRHELGHAFGMAADPKRSNTEDRFGRHCTNPGCSMRQTPTLRALLRTAAEEEDHSCCFCPQCMEDLRRFMASEHRMVK